MNKNQIEGASKELAGKAQHALGKAIGNEQTKGKGLIREAAGKAQRNLGDVEKAAKQMPKPPRHNIDY